jgi:hypothetical protein
VGRHIILLIGTVLAADRTSTPAAPLAPGRTTAVTVTVDVGAPLERAVASKFYAQAAAADAEQRWSDAVTLYREAGAEWAAAARLQPSRTLELAGAKAERERQRSQLLASRAMAMTSMGTNSRFGRDPFTRRADALDEGRQLRAKLMATRAALERVPAGLYARTRDRLREALRASAGAGPGASARMGGDGEIQLLLCATYAVGGEIEAARLARAHVTEAERADPANTVALAVCAAALGETRAALAELEIVALHPGPGRSDRFALRDLYLANDWDRLRGDPKFESLFPR